MTIPNARVILPAEATEEIASVGAASLDRPNVFMGGPSPLQKRRAKDAYAAMLSASPNSGRVTAKMLEAAAWAILKAQWEIAGYTPEDAAWIADSVIDGIADDCEDDALAARMSARAAFEAIGLTVEE